MDLSLIGEFIRKMRKQKGYTQQQLAEKLNISRYTMHKIEKGQLGEVSFVKIWSALRLLGYDLCITRHNPFKRSDWSEIFCEKEY